MVPVTSEPIIRSGVTTSTAFANSCSARLQCARPLTEAASFSAS